MKRIFRFVVGIFAVVGVGYVAVLVYVSFFLPRCVVISSARAQSPDSSQFAVFQKRTCEDRSLSRTSILVGAESRQDQLIALELQGISDVRLIWKGNRELAVRLPQDAVVIHRDGYTGDDGWPRISEFRVGSLEDAGYPTEVP